jgi:hypothetical protein
MMVMSGETVFDNGSGAGAGAACLSVSSGGALVAGGVASGVAARISVAKDAVDWNEPG